MIKPWRPIIEDINTEIHRISVNLSDVQFNSDFSHKLQIIKIRTAELEQRLGAVTHEMKSEAAAERAEIDLMMAELRNAVQETASALARLRILRAERARANYLRIQEIKKSETGEGGEA